MQHVYDPSSTSHRENRSAQEPLTSKGIRQAAPVQKKADTNQQDTATDPASHLSGDADSQNVSGQERQLPQEPWHVMQQKQERANKTPTIQVPVIQRRTGFEYEVNVPLLKNDGAMPATAPGSHDTTYKYLTRSGVQEKTIIEDKGYDDGLYKMVADHGAITEKVQDLQRLYSQDDYIGPRIRTLLESDSEEPAKVEYVTAALDESDDKDYQTHYTLQLTAVAEAIKALEALGPANQLTELSGGYAVGVPGGLQPPIVGGMEQTAGFNEKIAAVRNAVEFSAYMQATAGIDIKRVPELLNKNTPEQLVKHPSHRLVLEAMGGRAQTTLGAAGVKGDEPGAKELEGFVTLVLQYIVGYAIWKTNSNPGGTTKNLAPVWIKANLSALREALPNGGTALLNKHRQKIYNSLLKQAQELMGMAAGAFGARTLGEDEQPISGDEFSFQPQEAQFIFATFFNQYDLISEGGTIEQYQSPTGETLVPLEFRSLEDHPVHNELVASSLEIVHAVRALHGNNKKSESSPAFTVGQLNEIAGMLTTTPSKLLTAIWKVGKAQGIRPTQVYIFLMMYKLNGKHPEIYSAVKDAL